MATIQEIGSVVNCGITGLLGGGNLGCAFDFENLAGGELRLWKPGTVIPKETEYNRAYIRAQQQAGNVIIFNNIYDFAWNNEENVLNTQANTGLKSKLDDGKYEMDIMWKKGLYSQKQLSSVSIDNYWGVQLVDGQGNELQAENSNGDYVMLATALCSAKPIQFKTRSTEQLTTLQIQFSRPKQMNDDLTWFSGDLLDYGVGELDGANQVGLKVTTPTDGATTVVVKTVLAKDGSTFLAGLDESNFLLKSGGSTVVISDATANPTNKTYTLTVPALSTDDALSLTLYDSSENSNIILVGTAPNDKVYKSETVTTVVVA